MPLFLAAMEADQQQHLISLLAQAVQNYGAESAEVQADVVAKFGITPAQYIELYGHCYGGRTAGANGGMVMTDLRGEAQLPPQLAGGVLPAIKIGDFGLSRQLLGSAGGALAQTQGCGTPLYWAPEAMPPCVSAQLGGRDLVEPGAGAGYDGRVDLWAVGCILHELLLGEHPYQAGLHNRQQLLDRVRRNAMEERRTGHKCVFPVGQLPGGGGALSASCADLLQRLLMHDPRRRLSLAEFFEHPWLADDDAAAAAGPDAGGGGGE